jgi:acetolactate synthase-1/3 small subunit
MSMPAIDIESRRVVLELTANHHPGVLSHVCGLLARRAYNVEGLLCLPLADGSRCRIWLLVQEDSRIPNMLKQLHKLEDVLSVHHHPTPHPVFTLLAACVQG